MKKDILAFCQNTYNDVYQSVFTSKMSSSKKGKKNFDEVETAAQKEAIKQSIIKAVQAFPNEETANLWKMIYAVHIHRKSGIDDAETISKVISADQSWKKSSGHAFEEMISLLGSQALEQFGISIILQRDLNTLIANGQLDNEPRDISWLKEQIEASIFDLYAIVSKNGKKFCYGCIQSKTSIRDRVTRDREPSIAAMKSYFWSTVIVLDGDFLKNKKFITMVNGGSAEHPNNGWHGMYVFSEKYVQGRIYSTDIEMKNFKEHAIEASNYWLTQRQWFNETWTIA